MTLPSLIVKTKLMITHKRKKYAFVTEKDGIKYYRQINSVKGEKPSEIAVKGEDIREINIKKELYGK